MPTPKDLDKAGVYLILFFYSLIAALIGFLRGLKCEGWYCSYIFLIIGFIFLILAIKKTFF